MTVNYETYTNDKSSFLKRHNSDFRIVTSPMDEYNRYHKEYVCDDGAVFYEVMIPVYRKAEVVVEGITVEVDVELFQVEYWSSDDAKSKYYYEKYQ